MTERPPEPVPRPAGVSRQLAWLLGCVGLAVLAGWAARQGADLPREAAWMTAIFVLAAGLWITEALPLFATSLLVIGLQIVALANPGRWPGFGFEQGAGPSVNAILAAAADPVLLLFLGGFILAQAAVKEGVDRSMSALLLRPFGARPGPVLAGVLGVTALFSMFMSNTATTAMMITLVLPLIGQLPAGEPFRKALLLAVPFAANLGGMGSPIGSPPNAVAVGFLQKAGHPVGFLPWMTFAVPFMLAFLALTWALLWWFYRPRTQGVSVALAPHRVTRRGWLVVGVFVVTVALWLTDSWHGLPAAVVALVPAVVFTATGVIGREDVNSLDWNVLILIAGGISLGAGMQQTGLDQMVVRALPTHGALVLPLLVVATLGLSTFMSNTAAANLLLPIGLSIAAASGGELSPTRVAVDIALAASLAMALPISTPPNAIAFARGELTTRDMLKVGGLIGLAGAVLVLLVCSGPLLRLAGLR